MDEPILVTELDAHSQHALNTAYHQLKNSKVKILLASDWGPLQDNKNPAANLPVAGLHVDATQDVGDVQQLIGLLPAHKVLSLGVISGRNIWKTDLTATLDWLKPLAERLGERLWLAPSCSLLHVPVDLDSEEKLDPEVKNWLAFAKQKLQELQVLGQALNQRRASVQAELAANAAALAQRRNSPRVHRPEVQAAVAAITAALGQRQSPYAARGEQQAAHLRRPAYPTTTIGSFPQTPHIRRARSDFKAAGASAPPSTSRPCRQKSPAACASRKPWAWTCWCMARPTATTWSNTSVSSSMAMPSASTAGCSPTARAA